MKTSGNFGDDIDLRDVSDEGLDWLIRVTQDDLDHPERYPDEVRSGLMRVLQEALPVYEAARAARQAPPVS